jgi:N-methylhydantoinase A
MSDLRMAVDTGGTFTDLVIEGLDGLRSYKSPTTPDDPIRGVLDVVELAAADLDVAPDQLLGRTELFIHGTTRAINAILTGHVARTAFLTTRGHPDILLFREGGRVHPFDFTREYPPAYVPRALTFEVPERVGAAGEVVTPLDEPATVAVIGRLRALEVEAVAVCLLWSIANAAHELRLGELLAEHLPGVPFTLSHQLNPSLREYRRASSTAIDASLKPVMTEYLAGLESRLRAAGFGGRVLMVTSNGGVLDASAVAAAPIHAIGSGPAMAPVAGRHYAQLDAGTDTAVVADTGGTSYDVSLVRRGRIPWTRQTWLGEIYMGHMTGFPSVDVKSIGAGGGSIAWVDHGGLLRVGPDSAGADPGPACYGRGGTRPTVTDACVVLGYVDPGYFLGGAMTLDATAAEAAIVRDVGAPLGLEPADAAAAVMRLATEHMVRAIEEITLNQGIDPRGAVLVGGGGAAGLNAVAIARRLGSPRVLIPAVGAVLSAAGALMSELTADFAATLRTSSAAFDGDAANRVLDGLHARCLEFLDGPGRDAASSAIEFSVEARYPHQIWELEVPLAAGHFDGPDDVECLRRDFHDVHEELFAIRDPDSAIETVAWRARVRCRLRELPTQVVAPGRARSGRGARTRRAWFPDVGAVDVAVRMLESLQPGEALAGPAIVESPVTTVVIDPGASGELRESGTLVIYPWGVGGSERQRIGRVGVEALEHGLVHRPRR